MVPFLIVSKGLVFFIGEYIIFVTSNLSFGVDQIYLNAVHPNQSGLSLRFIDKIVVQTLWWCSNCLLPALRCTYLNLVDKVDSVGKVLLLDTTLVYMGLSFSRGYIDCYGSEMRMTYLVRHTCFVIHYVGSTFESYTFIVLLTAGSQIFHHSFESWTKWKILFENNKTIW